MNKTQGFTFHGTGTLRRIDAQTTKAGKSIKTLVQAQQNLPAHRDEDPDLVPF